MEEVQVEFDFTDVIPGLDRGILLHVTSGNAPCVQSRTSQSNLNTNKVVTIMGLLEAHPSFHPESSMLHLTRAQALALAGRLIDLVHCMDEADGLGNGGFNDLTSTEWCMLFLHFFQGMPLNNEYHNRFVLLGLLQPIHDGETLGSALPPAISN